MSNPVWARASSKELGLTKGRQYKGTVGLRDGFHIVIEKNDKNESVKVQEWETYLSFAPLDEAPPVKPAVRKADSAEHEEAKPKKKAKKKS